jgi:hypothetical protein
LPRGCSRAPATGSKQLSPVSVSSNANRKIEAKRDRTVTL